MPVWTTKLISLSNLKSHRSFKNVKTIQSPLIHLNNLTNLSDNPELCNNCLTVYSPFKSLYIDHVLIWSAVEYSHLYTSNLKMQLQDCFIIQFDKHKEHIKLVGFYSVHWCVCDFKLGPENETNRFSDHF